MGRTSMVWFGIHGGDNAEFGMTDLLKLRHLMEALDRRFPLSLSVISNCREKYDAAIRPWSIPTRYLEWHPVTFLPALKAHGVAVIPISPNPFTLCKTNNRMALSIHAGVAVVADAIPSYRAFSEACYLDDWEAGLERYLSDPDLRRRHVEIGQAIIAREWTIAHIADQWQEFFNGLLAKGLEKANSRADSAGIFVEGRLP